MLLALTVLLPALHVAVAAADAKTAARAQAELDDAGHDAAACATAAALLDTCFDDEVCAKQAVVDCDADAVVIVRVRREKDGPWVSTRVVDASGTTAFAYDEPRPDRVGPALLPPALLSTLPSLPSRKRATDHVVKLMPERNDRERAEAIPVSPGSGPQTSMVPYVVAGVGGAVVVGAGAAALLEQGVLYDESALAQQRTDARNAAQLAWVLAGAGVVVAVAGGAWMLMQ